MRYFDGTQWTEHYKSTPVVKKRISTQGVLWGVLAIVLLATFALGYHFLVG